VIKNWNNYQFRYTAVTPNELWNELENVLYENNFDLGDNFTVTQFMKSWTEQAGYPLIKISKENDTFVITQVIIDLIRPVF